jgi:hypothetical protein
MANSRQMDAGVMRSAHVDPSRSSRLVVGVLSNEAAFGTVRAVGGLNDA